MNLCIIWRINMDSKSKNTLNKLANEDDFFSNIIKKITLQEDLQHNEYSYMLSMSILFSDEYKKNKNRGFFEFAYYLVLYYSLKTKNFSPLLDFSINNGFYPITKSILTNYDKTIIDSVLEYGITKYGSGPIIELKEQREKIESLLSSNSAYRAYVAPTSYGKSSFIKEDILREKYNKIGIIVPKKALIWQTYRDIKDVAKDKQYRVLMHDTEYNNENRIIGVFTQERAIRLIQENNIFFDILYIDEAHKLFEKDERNILLARLIRLNRKMNKNHKVIYLSPLINDVSNLKLYNEDIIELQKIEFSIKEYKIKIYNEDIKKISYYNRFVDKEYDNGEYCNSCFDYINQEKKKKNLIYFFKPKDIEKFAKDLITEFSDKNDSELNNIANMIAKYTNKEYYMIDLIKRGVIYIHGKIPDIIKDYLLTKFKSCSKINYLISNTTILEGVNFPIDNIFIMDVRNLTTNDLINLCGRVNRLNEIFTSPPQLDKLLCPINFVKTIKYSGNQSFMNKIKLLRCDEKDNVENPLLVSSKLNIEKKNSIKKIEDEYIESFTSKTIRTILIKNNINNFYKNFDSILPYLEYRIQNANKITNKEELVDLAVTIFIFGSLEKEITDVELLRLNSDKAQKFYKYYLDKVFYADIKTKIGHFLKYFSDHENDQSLFYIGNSFGEEEYNSGIYNGTRKVYIDLRKHKQLKDRINLAVIKSKIEDDFLNYKFAKLVKSLFDLQLIDENLYNKYLYNTVDIKIINLLKLGFSFQLINFVEDKNLGNEITITKTGITVTEKFREALSKEDDFIQYEIKKFI